MKVYEILKEKATNGEGIIKEVANFIVESTDNDYEAKTLLEDITRFGCASGVVCDMIYYTQTHDFFDRHYDEIEKLRQEYDYEIKEGEDLKNQLAWFAYEVKALELLGLIEE